MLYQQAVSAQVCRFLARQVGVRVACDFYRVCGRVTSFRQITYKKHVFAVEKGPLIGGEKRDFLKKN